MHIRAYFISLCSFHSQSYFSIVYEEERTNLMTKTKENKWNLVKEREREESK